MNSARIVCRERAKWIHNMRLKIRDEWIRLRKRLQMNDDLYLNTNITNGRTFVSSRNMKDDDVQMMSH